MKKLIILFCVLLALPVRVGAAKVVSTAAESCVLYCPQNGRVLFSRNSGRRMKPASTTKLMTTLLTLEAAHKRDRVVTFTREMAAEGSSMYLKYGEKLRLSDLAVGMMMCSGNDAANAAAVTVGGSADKFAEMMNDRASEIGMKHTHFVTPSGLDDDGHYSTAYDMALLMAEAIKNKSFAQLTKSKSAEVSFVEPQGKRVSYPNHNKLLRLYADCVGGKTGYTKAAGRCLVSAARRDGLTLICVTLNDRDDWNDHQSLYDYGFTQLAAYTPEPTKIILPCVGGDKERVSVCCEKQTLIVSPEQKSKIHQTIYAERFLYAPVKKGQRAGRVVYTCDGKVLRTVSLSAESDVNAQTDSRGIWQKIKERLLSWLKKKNPSACKSS